MKRNPGEWLRERLLDRMFRASVLASMGAGLLIGAGSTLWTVFGVRLFFELNYLVSLLPGLAFLVAALYMWRNDEWSLSNMRKGARAEKTTGQAIEHALTRDACAVAHGVEVVARVGDIDHLVATPRGLWVIETKHGRVPSSEFRKTLQRIAANVEGLRERAPQGTRVTGCLVFASEQRQRPKSTYTYERETIRAFSKPEELVRELRNEARGKGDSSDLAKWVWKLGKLDIPDQPAPDG